MEQDRESLGAASKALAEAASQLAHALGSQARQAADAGTAFSDAVTSSLRGAAADISAASATLSEQVSRRDDRRPRKADQTRADLLAAGARVFAARGFEGASVDDIARDAGYTKGAVYAHFGSKRDLFLAIALGSVAATSHCDALPGLETGAIDEPALAGHLVRLGEDPAMLLALEILAYALRHPEVPLVMDFVDVDSAKWRAYADEATFPMRSVYRREAATLGARLDSRSHYAEFRVIEPARASGTATAPTSSTISPSACRSAAR